MKIWLDKNLEDYFTDIDVFNNSDSMNMNNSIEQQNPWGPTMQCSSSSNSKIVNDEGWANFLNDPFASSPMVSIMNQPPQFSKEAFNNTTTTTATTESVKDHVNDDLINKPNNVEENLFFANITSSSSPKRTNDNNNREDDQIVANSSMIADDPNNDSTE
ncbi:hypothetical protein BLA29_000007 [Euroglyphus maynei]|uniref:Uncharacterized protein n=1 Tax=Euroglyphus maynei TaxID=6958 RepID=A0A1Y3B3Y9_EURMA|nr:hypothetical protein BLA29_000007 [Euroglyphus maynei]